MTVTLGRTVEDEITGFTGIALGRCQYLTGCTQVLVQPRLNKDGVFVEPRWIDEDRLKVVGDHVVKLSITTYGFDKQAPIL